MTRKHLIAAVGLASAALASQPAAAYDLTISGRTLASHQLAVDVLRDIARYSRATGGCSFIFSADMRVLPASYVPPSVRARGGHVEQWSLNACAARQRFEVTMWPSPSGGSDYTIRPLTGRIPLYVR